jgi:hypothetical protein
LAHFLTIRKTKKGDVIDVDALALTEEVEILEELPPTIMCDPNNPTKFTIRLPGIKDSTHEESKEK